MKLLIILIIAISLSCNNTPTTATSQGITNKDSSTNETVNTDSKITDSSNVIPSNPEMPKDALKVDTLKIAAAFNIFAASASMSIAQDDVEYAWTGIWWAWNDHGPCTQEWLCKTHIGNFQIKFGDGYLPGQPQLVHRWFNSAHDCIKHAKDAVSSNPVDRGLAVTWVMASQIHNKAYYEWLRNHGDAVLEALKRIPRT